VSMIDGEVGMILGRVRAVVTQRIRER
jgi:hypothetical protein